MIADAGVMNLPTVIMIGAVLGGLEGATIFFEPREPYKWQILCAATLGGVLVALLTAFSVTASTRWWYAMVIGAFYGFAFALVVYLAKGGPKSGDALSGVQLLDSLSSCGRSRRSNQSMKPVSCETKRLSIYCCVRCLVSKHWLFDLLRHSRYEIQTFSHSSVGYGIITTLRPGKSCRCQALSTSASAIASVSMRSVPQAASAQTCGKASKMAVCGMLPPPLP